MIRILLYTCLCSTVLCYSCQCKENKSDENEGMGKSYALIFAAFATSKQAQENFFGKATELLGQVKNDKNAVVNTKELDSLLNQARRANESQVTLIATAGEPDDEIKYRAKALVYVNLVKGLYNNEFPQFITVLHSKAEDRFEKSKTILYAKMKEMATAMNDCHEAGVELREKYNIQMVDAK